MLRGWRGADNSVECEAAPLESRQQRGELLRATSHAVYEDCRAVDPVVGFYYAHRCHTSVA